MKPVHIFIDGQELLGWTDMTLSRSKTDLTGSFSASIFFTYMPDEPVMPQMVRARDITIYVGGHLAFFGKIDKRRGSGVHSGAQGSQNRDSHGRFTSGPKGNGFDRSASASANEYTVKITARGQTKYLVDSSHQTNKKYNLEKPTDRKAIETLIEPWGIEVEYLGTENKLDIVRFRDGALVVDEIQRLAAENGLYVYETRDGKLRITPDTGRVNGEALILGDNILSFSAEQSEGQAHSEIKVKGQRTDKNTWGEDAVLPTVKIFKDGWVKSNVPIIIQHYGDASPEALDRRGKYEADRRSAFSKTVNVDVFHVQSRTGEPWDIGTLHYVEIPPEGIYDVFECTELTYSVQADGELKTSLTLSPPPSQGSSAGSDIGGAMSALNSLVPAYVNPGGQRRSAAGNGEFPDPWTGPDLAEEPVPLLDSAVNLFAGVLGSLTVGKAPPALSLPAGFESEDE